MVDVRFHWDMDNDPEGNVFHIAEHGLTVDEVISAFESPDAQTVVSRSSGRPLTFGTSHTGRYLAIAWEVVSDDPLEVYVVTAYEPTEE